MVKALTPQYVWGGPACGDGCCDSWVGGLRPADLASAVKEAEAVLAAGGHAKFRRRRNGVALMVFKRLLLGDISGTASVVFLIDVPR